MNKIVSYSIGLVLAVILTGAAFSLVLAHIHGQSGLQSTVFIIAIVLLLAMVQLIVQLVFFLHIGQEKDSRWNAALFVFTFFGILVIVVASVWIMYHLNYRMTPSEKNQYITNQSSF